MDNIFRVLIVSSYVVYFFLFWIPEVDYFLYDEGTVEVLEWSGFGAMMPLNEFYDYAFFVGYSVILAGLLGFKSWARPAFVSITVLSVIYTALQGLLVLPAIESTMLYITTLIDGATISIMYLTSIDARFNESA